VGGSGLREAELAGPGKRRGWHRDRRRPGQRQRAWVASVPGKGQAQGPLCVPTQALALMQGLSLLLLRMVRAQALGQGQECPALMPRCGHWLGHSKVFPRWHWPRRWR